MLLCGGKLVYKENQHKPPRGWQQVLGGVKHCCGSCRHPWSTRLCKCAHLGQRHVSITWLSPCGSVAGTGSSNKKLEERWPLPVAHVCTCFETLNIWLHWTTIPLHQVASVTIMCGALWNERESCPELWRAETLRERGKTLNLIVVYVQPRDISICTTWQSYILYMNVFWKI